MTPDTPTPLAPKLRFPEFRDSGPETAEKICGLLYSEASSLAQNKLNFIEKGYPVYGADGLVGHIEEYDQNEDYIAIVKDGAGVGRLFLYEKKSSVLGTLNYLKTHKRDHQNLAWIFYLLQTLDFSKYIVGSGIPHIYFRDYSQEIILVPSIWEQQKIADCLGSLDDLIAAEDRKLEALRQHKQGLMQQLFPQPGETVPGLRFPRFQKAGEWKPIRLGRIGEVVGGGTPDTSDPQYWGGNIQWFTPAEVNDRILSKSKRTITREGLSNSSAKLLPIGTLLVTTRANIGDIGIAGISCTTNQGFQSIVVANSEVNKFWYYWLTRNVNELIKRASGSTFLEIGKTEIKKIPVLCPSKEEQQKIADCLWSLDDILSEESQKLEALRQHKHGLMQKLFPIFRATES